MSFLTGEYYVARQVLCQILETRLGYDVSGYAGASPQDVEVMRQLEGQLDMVFDTTWEERAGVDNADGPVSVKVPVPAAHRVFVKFPPASKITAKNILGILADLEAVDGFRPRQDTLVLVVDFATPTAVTGSKSVCGAINDLWHLRGVNVILHQLSRLQFNALNHEMQPPIMRVLSEAENAAFEADHPGLQKKCLYTMSRFDPMAALLCARPGDIVHCRRRSPTAMWADDWSLVTVDLIGPKSNVRNKKDEDK